MTDSQNVETPGVQPLAAPAGVNLLGEESGGCCGGSACGAPAE
ncbi:hypothetical protein [uncultured Microbacterium sp.]|nr:hypothetical protein [uncultured Microbacterium sp.]